MSDHRPWHEDPEYTAVCHEADMDGLGCALLLDQFTAIENIEFANYPLSEGLGAEGKVVVCDLGLPPDSPAWQNPDLVVFDHHAEAPEGAEALVVEAHDDGDRCGAMLLYLALQNKLYGDRRPWERFVAMVNAGDLYDTESELFPKSRNYTWLLNKLGMSRLFGIARANVEGFLDLPDAILAVVDSARARENAKAYDAAAALARSFDHEGLPEFVITLLSGGDRSEVLSRVAEAYGKPVVGLCLSDISGPEKRVEASVRDPNGQAREIAQAFGGGGHREAAGFEMDLADAMSMWVRGTA